MREAKLPKRAEQGFREYKGEMPDKSRDELPWVTLNSNGTLYVAKAAQPFLKAKYVKLLYNPDLNIVGLKPLDSKSGSLQGARKVRYTQRGAAYVGLKGFLWYFRIERAAQGRRYHLYKAKDMYVIFLDKPIALVRGGPIGERT